MFGDTGWRQAIVSNHCPELETLVDGLGIGAFFDKVYSSTCTGYEKPHPRSIPWLLVWLAPRERKSAMPKSYPVEFRRREIARWKPDVLFVRSRSTSRSGSK